MGCTVQRLRPCVGGLAVEPKPGVNERLWCGSVKVSTVASTSPGIADSAGGWASAAQIVAQDPTRRTRSVAATAIAAEPR
eukprot:203457-Chlamydomonas_euryale.AAC.3